MSKYTPLREHLDAQPHDHIPMSFTEIEQLLGFSLPASKQYPAWWSNNPSNNPMTREWLDAGFETENVNTPAGQLVFRRVERPLSGSKGGGTSSGSGDNGHKPERKSVFGCMKGTLTIAPGYDITQPADPDWGTVYQDD